MSIQPGTAGHEILPRLLDIAAQAPDINSFLEDVVSAIREDQRPLDQVAIVQGIKGAWRQRATAGGRPSAEDTSWPAAIGSCSRPMANGTLRPARVNTAGGDRTVGPGYNRSKPERTGVATLSWWFRPRR